MEESSAHATLDTVIVVTTRMAELADFYCCGLGLPMPQPHSDNHLGFQLPGVYLGFDLVDEVPAHYPGAVSLWFAVDDLEATFDRFVQSGARVKYPPTEKPWGARLAAVFDPDGNVVGLTQRQP